MPPANLPYKAWRAGWPVISDRVDHHQRRPARPIDTDANPANGPMRDMLHSFMAIKRHGQPEEVAGMVAWLAGPEASFVTGAMHTIDGAFGA